MMSARMDSASHRRRSLISGHGRRHVREPDDRAATAAVFIMPGSPSHPRRRMGLAHRHGRDERHWHHATRRTCPTTGRPAPRYHRQRAAMQAAVPMTLSVCVA